MPLGNNESTLLSELNRLANGGVYPEVNLYDEAGAARAWAERQDIPLTTTDTVGVLNEIAGLPRDSWLDYSGVCNYIAGTTGLPAAAALRQVEGDVQTPTPSEPLLLIATPGNQSVTINWAPPANSGDAPIDKYRVAVVDHPEIIPIETTSNPFTFTGLTNGTLYFFTVEAHNEFGWGPAATSPGATPVAPPKPVVSGGTLSYYDGYFYRAFTSTADLGVANGPLEAEVLVIGGGASGSYYGGGGAGGVLIQSLTLQPGNYTATVGAGGGPSGWTSNPGGQSSFDSIVALGGSTQGQVGGSGSGDGNAFGIGIGTPGQGFNGGTWAFRAGGGGGGAAGPGANAGTYVGGTGGPAILLQDWASATGLGVNGYFAGGGGGSGRPNNAVGGGGGAGNAGPDAGSYIYPYQYAVNNTGSGGGATSGGTAGPGGSGVVIVRYPQTAVDFVPYSPTATTTWYSAYCNPGGGAYNNGYRQNPETGICWNPNYAPPGDPFFPSDNVQVTNYTCPLGGFYNSSTGMCESSYQAVPVVSGGYSEVYFTGGTAWYNNLNVDIRTLVDIPSYPYEDQPWTCKSNNQLGNTIIAIPPGIVETPGYYWNGTWHSFYCPAGGGTTVYTCPQGGTLNPTTNMCQ